MAPDFPQQSTLKLAKKCLKEQDEKKNEIVLSRTPVQMHFRGEQILKWSTEAKKNMLRFEAIEV